MGRPKKIVSPAGLPRSSAGPVPMPRAGSDTRADAFRWQPVSVGLQVAADHIGIGLTLMKELVRDKRIPTKRLEGRVLIRWVDLHAYIDGLPDAETKAAQ